MRHLPSSVLTARDAYLGENGFTVAGYDDAWTPASALGIRFAVPNTATHRWALMHHDLHHVATGYGTDIAGEAEISAWELRRGLRCLGLYVGLIVTMGALTGLVVAPRRTVRAFRAAGRGRSLFQREHAYEALLAMGVAELRRYLDVPAAGLARERALHAFAPKTPPLPSPRPQRYSAPAAPTAQTR